MKERSPGREAESIDAPIKTVLFFVFWTVRVLFGLLLINTKPNRKDHVQICKNS